MENRKDLATILNQAQVFYLATADEDGTPHVRPFGAVARYEGHTWFCTGKGKAVYEQMMKNTKVELAAMVSGGEAPCWVRAKGMALYEENEGAREAMFASRPKLKDMYADRMEKFVMFRLVETVANLYDINGNVMEELEV